MPIGMNKVSRSSKKPIGIPDSGLLHRYDATKLSGSDGDSVTTTPDLVASDDLTGDTATLRADIIRGNKVLEFDGSSDHDVDLSTTISSPYDIYAVGEWINIDSGSFDYLVGATTSGGNTDGVFADNDGPDFTAGGDGFIIGSTADTDPHIHLYRMGNDEYHIDGSVFTGSIGTLELQSVGIAGLPRDTNQANLYWGEMLIYDPTVGGYSVSDVKSYLSDKWSIAV